MVREHPKERPILLGMDEDGNELWVPFKQLTARNSVPDPKTKIDPPTTSNMEYADIFLLPVNTPASIVKSHNRPYNDDFPLRWYIPSATASEAPSLAKNLFIFMNGFGEGSTVIWDRMGDRLAELVLHPFCCQCQSIFAGTRFTTLTNSIRTTLMY